MSSPCITPALIRQAQTPKPLPALTGMGKLDLGRVATEEILNGLEGIARSVSRKRAQQMEGDSHQAAQDIAQEMRLSFWRALQDWDVDGPNTAEFTSYAFQRAKLDGRAAATREIAPAAPRSAAGAFMGALSRCGGDFEAAKDELVNHPDAKRRFTPAHAEFVAAAFVRPTPIATVSEGSLEASPAQDPDHLVEYTSLGTAPRTARLHLAVTNGRPVVAGATTVGWCTDLQPSLAHNPLAVSRDAVRCKGVKVTGTKRGKHATGAIVDHAAEAETSARFAAAAQVKAIELLARMSPTEVAIAHLAYGFDGNPPMLTDAGKLDATAIAEALGKTPGTVKATWSRAMRKLRAAA
ncbi:sigma-70 family RNA polymerase sigma factor [Streptomyces sp. FH025]|uniref:sigma-70 family RNA polymerase sigma factor n=1 Tax=Streptomyces sp. FH025 TaxID=2815937 RepID=UPI001A9F8966|nr:sigma-70 family RNA polymerase sigma factor [Streptomyces sp. FH025]MBO1415536.1 sigma-70 family RNA polymerase sigma factor [Streptomyces sp. FH025]